MALGTLGIGALLLAGGLGANTYVQKQRADQLGRDTRMILENAQNKQSELDAERQQTLGDALNEAAVGRNQVEKRQGEKADQMVDRMEANVNRGKTPENAPDKAGIDGPAGRVMGKAVSRQADANEAENSQKRRAMADMDSLGDVLTENDNIFRPAYGEIQANQRIARGEEARIPLEVQAARAEAANKHRELEIAGQIAQGVGSGMVAGGGNFFAAPGAAGAGSTVASAGGPGAVAGVSTGRKISRIPQIVY